MENKRSKQKNSLSELALGGRYRKSEAEEEEELSDQGILEFRDFTDFIELRSSHLEFSGHLADGERPAAVHHHTVFTESPLGQDQSIQDHFCL